MDANQKKNAKGSLVIVTGSPEEDQALTPEFQAQGYEVIICTDPNKALKLHEAKQVAWKPALFLIDLINSKMSGFELTRRLRERYTEETTPIILMSKHSSPEDNMEATGIGAAALLQKPLTMKDIEAALEKHRSKKIKTEVGAQAFSINYE